ncbi:MAG: hypothetical protein AB7S36_23115 [Planctomycetota bacterium]
MSYEEYPDEFQILKGSLENEDYDRAESVLLMILQKRPDFQQAKLDLERVRGKLGSISNYEFRVRAFLDQGDIRTAGEIVAEATMKFTKNRKIKQLIEFFKEKAAKVEGSAAPAGGGGGMSLDSPVGAASNDDAGGDDVLPNLETFSGPVDAASIKKVKENFAKRGVMPGAESAAPAGGGRGARDDDDDDDGGGRAPAGGGGGIPAATGLRSRREALAEARSTSPASGARKRGGLTGVQIVQRRVARAEGALQRDAFVAGGVFLLVIAVMAVLIVVLMTASSESVASVKPDTSVLSQPQHKTWSDALASWDTNSDTQKDLLIKGLFSTQKPDIEFADAMYFTLAEKRETDAVVESNFKDLYEWRLRVRRDAGQHTPVDPAGLGEVVWQPDAFPPKYGTSALQKETFSIIASALLLSVVPGILLGAVLAWCRLPLANRVFQLVWELWYAVPAVALIYMGLWFLPNNGFTGPIAGILLGVAMIPHVAFYCRQGFENIVGRNLGVSIGLGAVVVVSAVLAATGRFVAEGVLVLGVTSIADAPAAMQPVHTMGREIMTALSSLHFPDLMAPGDATHELRWDVAVYMAFWLFVVSFALSLLAQLLQAVVAWEGLKNADPEAPTEMPEHRSQAPFGLRNLGTFGLGLIITMIVVVLGLAAVGSTGVGAPPGSGWDDVLHQDMVQRGMTATLTHAATAGAVGALVGFIMIIAPILMIDTRRMHAMVDCAFRIPAGISPVLMVVLCVIILRSLHLDPAQWVSAVLVGLVLAPLGSAMLYSGWSQYRRGPYVHDMQGYRPKNFGLWFARLLEFIAVALFLAAVAAGSYTLVSVFGGNTSATNEGQFGSLPVQLMYAISQPDGYTFEAAHVIYMGLLKLIAMLLGLGFMARVVAEIMARFALARRGPGLGYEDYDG